MLVIKCCRSFVEMSTMIADMSARSTAPCSPVFTCVHLCSLHRASFTFDVCTLHSHGILRLWEGFVRHRFWMQWVAAVHLGRIRAQGSRDRSMLNLAARSNAPPTPLLLESGVQTHEALARHQTLNTFWLGWRLYLAHVQLGRQCEMEQASLIRAAWCATFMSHTPLMIKD